MRLKFVYALFLLALPIVLFAQEDEIILRNGGMKYVKVVMVNGDKLIYRASEKPTDPEQEMELKDIYMIHYKTRGNVYIKEDGKRVNGERQERHNNADLIYLVQGREIVAYNVQVIGDDVTYQEKQKSKKKNLFAPTKLVPGASFTTAEVFMIKYADGTREIITPLKEEEKVEEKVEQPVDTLPDEPEQLVVVYHNASGTETLLSIAQKYDVTVTDIRQWNDIPAKIKNGARLKKGMQLMLYIKPEEQEEQ